MATQGGIVVKESDTFNVLSSHTYGDAHGNVRGESLIAENYPTHWILNATQFN